MPKAKEYPHTSVKCSRTYTKTGLVRHVVEIQHLELGKYRVIKDPDARIAGSKALAQLKEWHQQWEKKERIRKQKGEAAQRTALAEAQLAEAEGILQAGLAKGIKLTARSKRFRFQEKEPQEPTKPELQKEPTKPKPREEPRKPRRKRRPPKPEPDVGTKPSETAARYQAKPGLLAWLLGGSRAKREATALQHFRADLAAWETAQKEALERWNTRCQELDLVDQAALSEWDLHCRKASQKNQAALLEWEKRVAEVRKKNAEKQETYKTKVTKWEEKCRSWAEERESHEAEVRSFFERYRNGEREAVRTYVEAVLDESIYPDWFPREYDIYYDPETKVAIVDSRLPAPVDLPTAKGVTYVQARDEFTEKAIPVRDRERLYDSAIYQVALRTLHECFKATPNGVLESVVFNGYVRTKDAATGKRIRPCILSIQAQRSEFSPIDLASVDPKECVRKLRGVGSSKLHALAPIAPILSFDKKDSRFVEGRDILGRVSEGSNLAAMDWEDFEHLIRGVFEGYFADIGGDVRVTQASRDKGVDAVVFDPDPVTGGKIIIQAKRYTNTVSVAAVRELLGTVQNEGAKLGILVTTSQFGPDAIHLAAEWPINLIDGGNLLHLLEKQGHKAYIDIREAREILKEREGDASQGV